MGAVLRPRDAATLIVVDRSEPRLRVLMGRRRPDQVFLPDTFVFPGGRVEPCDRMLARHYALPSNVSAHVQRSMNGRPSDRRASALALAALRETFEETGLLVGKPSPEPAPAGPGAWAAFAASGFAPKLDGLTFFARAITPPSRPRRYDTRFFIVDSTAIAHRSERTDGELLDIGWFTLKAARGLKLPSITRHVLADVAALEQTPAGAHPAAIPFYFHRRGSFQRTLVDRADGAP